MLRGELYVADDPELGADHARASALLERYNRTRLEELEERDRLLRELLGSVGEGVIVCPGVTIGDDTVVGAGAVVTEDLPAGVLAAGVPATVKKQL